MRLAGAAAGCAGLVAGLVLPVAGASQVLPAITNQARVAVGHRSPRDVRATWEASNWSGYALTGTFTGVSGTWTVPSVAASASPTYSSAWIGVDGFNDSDLIQTGTEEDYYDGSAHYDAWWEILPAAETEISTSAYPVAPGDRMSAEIYETASTTSGTGGGRHGSSRLAESSARRGGGVVRERRKAGVEHEWVITLSDLTAGWTFSTTQAYGGPGSSAEWILEAPEVGGSISTLAHYTIVPPSGLGDFDNAAVATSVPASGAPSYSAAGLAYGADGGVMVQNGVQVSTPSDPDTAATAFDLAYGSAQPSAPTG